MDKNRIPVITLDGPSGTGKGSLCQMLAEHLHWPMLDSGAIYRALALAAQRRGIAMDVAKELSDLARHLDLRFESSKEGGTKILLDGLEVSEAIRSEQCGQNASQIAALVAVREALLERQRAFAVMPGLVTDGRDMGTVVFPNAVLKFYLHASLEERAKRRYVQLKNKGIHVSLAHVVEDMVQRDSRDLMRVHAPLRPAPDSIRLDTTRLNIEQVFASVLKLVEERLN